MDDYLEYCEKVRGMTAATMEMKRNVLRRFWRVTGIKYLTELTNAVFDRWIKHETARGVSPRSINMYNAVVIAMVRYYKELGVKVPLNLTLIRKLKEGEVRRGFYTAEEIEDVIDAVDLQTGLIIRIMFETGMRIAEITKLRLSNFRGRQIKFIGKGRKPREVYITEETLQLLNHYINIYGVKDFLWGFYECGGNGEAPTVNTIRNRLKRAFKKAGFDDFYPHSLRHSFATDLQRRGASVAEIKEMIGHSNIATTERYLHGFDGKMKELFDKYR
ncbi:tyrosine-type recombinase/integrase [Candidatus Saccharibacteria bacterium]|nr:tyrosine-type recombinase/integrase [Candidatus Saccharibacteria bacterium]